MSSLLSAELSATCNALGYFDTTKNVYYADDNTLETVKDLIRYLRRDDSNHDIRRQLGETKVLQTDLIPLLKSYWEQTELFDVILRLIVNLTTPALMLWDSTVPVEKHARNLFIQIVDHLQSYKESFTDEGIWSILCSKLSKILEIDFMERGDEYSLIIERILILIRNILYVPPDPYEYRPDNDATVHDQVLWSLHQSGMLDILLYMSSASSEEAYYMHVLEVLSFMFKEQSAHELANAALQRSETEKLRDEAELLSIRHRETKEKRDKIRMYNSVRHSRFGGTFVVKSMKSVGDNELISHKPLDRIDALTFNVEKKKPRTPKNRLPLKDPNNERRSAFSIRLFLKEFCMEFLNASYNTLMHQAKIKLDRAVAQAHDESYYLWAMRFFMEFNRSYKFEVKLVSETMSIGSFHYVQRQMEKYYDMISSDKKNLRLWSRRLHLALLAYRELLYTLSAMEKSQDITVKESARVIKSNIFYVMEYRELILTLLGMYDELKMSPAYLNDLIETQHVFLRMLQSYCGSGQFVTQKKARKKPKKSSRATPVAAGNEEPQLEDEWDEVAPQLSIVLEGAIQTTTDVVPFDAASDVPIDEQKSEAMKNVQRILREGDLESAVGLLRAAREVWPENDCFGSNNMSPEEEFLALRDIYFADLGLEKTIKSTPAVEEHNDEEEEEEEGYDYDGPTEINFQFSDFEKRLARPKIVQACALALRNFERNSPLTNHCIVKLLHRIAWDCKMHAMIFQASVFRTFQEIFKLKYLPQYKELVKFAIFIVRKFIEAAQKNPLIYMEALCWKSAKETYDLEEGYGTYSEKSQAAQKVWTELEEEELKTLFMEHQQKNIEEDVVDWISKNLINDTRSRRAIIHKLKTMYLITNYSKRPKSGGTSSKLSSQWSAAEEQQLRELFEQYEDAMDPLGCIMDRLDVRRPKNRIVEKLLTMGLIHDKKQMRKKRTKKSNRSQESTGDDSFNSGSDDDTNMQSTKASSSSVLQQQTQPKKKKKKDASSSAKKKKSVQLSSNQLAKLLIEMVEADMGNALEWIKECIDDLVDDIENDPDDDDEGVPIVPIMESSVTAMEDEKFLYLLRAFRFEEPANEQEIYWRIPAHLSVDTLKNYSSTITQAIEKTLIVINDEEVSETNAEINNDGDLSDGRQSRNDDSEVENDENLSRTPSCNETVEPPGNEAPQPARSAKKKTRKIVRVEDSESDSDKENPIDETVNAESTSNKRNRSLLLDSDEDDADSLPTNKKPKKFIDSEDDDE